MSHQHRREFLANVGKGMLVASVGPALAAELGVAPAFAADVPERLLFGDREPLVSLMQDTPANKLLPILLDKLKAGVKLEDLAAAGALANARQGISYEGHHCFNALLPALQMGRELPEARRALPLLKVLHRNTFYIQDEGGSKKEILHPVTPVKLPKGRPANEALREIFRKRDLKAAESTFAALAQDSLDEAYNHLQYCVHDEIDVHRVVISWRAWAMIDLVGKENALTLLRHSVQFCVPIQDHPNIGIRTVLPKLLEQYHLLGKKLGERQPEDAWVDRLALTIYSSTPAQAAEAAAAALGEGVAPTAVAEAISLAANRLVLCDAGRTKDGGPQDRPGSVHGNSVGVHASDAANAWRNIALVTNARNTFASLIVAAFQTAVRPELNSTKLNAEPFPLPAHLEKVTAKDATALLHDAEAAIKAKDQASAAALVHRYGELKLPERPVFDMMLKYAVSEDGALHAEKYYRTVCEEFAATRPAFRWRQLVALARVTASEFGYPSPGYTEAARLTRASLS